LKGHGKKQQVYFETAVLIVYNTHLCTWLVHFYLTVAKYRILLHYKGIAIDTVIDRVSNPGQIFTHTLSPWKPGTFISTNCLAKTG